LSLFNQQIYSLIHAFSCPFMSKLTMYVYFTVIMFYFKYLIGHKYIEQTKTYKKDMETRKKCLFKPYTLPCRNSLTGVARNLDWEWPKLEKSCDVSLVTLLGM